MRICSLLPSSTEIVYALGLGEQLVGVTHECDYPEEALRKPHITRSLIPSSYSSAAIDQLVREQLHDGGALYELRVDVLKQLKPDLILTQRLCDVCAVSYNNVARAARLLNPVPNVVSLEPNRLNDIFENIIFVGKLVGTETTAHRVVVSLRERVDRVVAKTRKARQRPRVLCLEWMDPPFCAGHWIPELVTLAGGVDELGLLEQDSKRISWDAVVNYNPDMIIIMCCGFSIKRTLQEISVLQNQPSWDELKAVKSSHVYVADGNAYFSRPGPRIVESLEILAKIFHPGLFPDSFFHGAVYPLEQHELHELHEQKHSTLHTHKDKEFVV
ncbi:MAG: cobalamin-binding protein [Ignavibacteriales bacterium]|nr:cobalamin-binding protein [Ignavibacteriales bacterium]